MSQYHKKDFKHRHAKLIKGATKLALSLAILAGFVMLIWYGYLLFTHKVAPLIGSIVFIVGIAVWVILIRILRKRYKWTKPSFKLTTFSVIAIVLILTFAGVQPLASYKDHLIESYKTAQAERAAEIERAAAERAAEEERVAEEEAAARAQREAEMAAAGADQEYDFYKEYITLFNQFRQGNGATPLVFTPDLNELANQRCKEISVVFSHEGVPSGCGENIAMGYSSPSSLLNGWASSTGHRMNMLSSMYTSTGFATDGYYSVQLFR